MDELTTLMQNNLTLCLWKIPAYNLNFTIRTKYGLDKAGRRFSLAIDPAYQ